jgi:hypothetical protein
LPEANQGGASSVVIWSAAAVLLVLLLLFVWSRQLRVLIGVISVWLELAGESIWERDFRAYHKAHAPVSQTKLVSWAFFLLGFAVPGLVLAVRPGAGGAIPRWTVVVLAVVDVVYLLVVTGYGFLGIGIDEKQVLDNWVAIRAALKPSVPSQGTQQQPPASENKQPAPRGRCLAPQLLSAATGPSGRDHQPPDFSAPRRTD